MGELWGLIELDGDEALKCQSCYVRIRNQKVHILLNVDDAVEEVMCDTCWKENEMGER